jgi:hypothetical protein
MVRWHEMWRSRSAGLLGALAAVAITAAGGVPLASASSHLDGPYARTAAAVGVFYGGRTPQDWPVVIELSKNRRQVVQAIVGLPLSCTSGRDVNLRDRWINIDVNKKRKFHATTGLITRRNDDGTTTDAVSTISGALNRARSKVSGKWRFKFTVYTSAGEVIDTCDSGSVRWSAKQ